VKFVIPQKDLIKVLKPAFEAVPSRPTHPVLNNLKLTVSDGRLTVCGTDLRTTVVTSQTCKVVSEGAITVPAKLFCNIVSSVNGDVSIELKNESLLLVHSQGEYSFNTLPVDEFPGIDKVEVNHTITGDFTEALSRVMVAASDEETKRILTGIRLKYHDKEDRFDVAATNGHFLCKHDISPTMVEGDGFDSCVLPKLAVSIAIKYATESIEIGVADRYVKLVANDVTIIGNILDGTYPVVEQLIPPESNDVSKMLIEPKLLLEAINRLSVLSKDDPIVFKLANNALEVSRLSRDICSGVESITVSGIGDIQVAFNCNYLKDIINTAKLFPEIRFGFTSPTSSCIIKTHEWLSLLMPIQVRN
jgi:DNA polymerase-3 subunit beta